MSQLIDLHCHILPYVDDGAENLEEALDMLRLQTEQGVSRVVLTPHCRTKMFETDEDTIQRQFQRLCREAGRRKGMPELLLGREYFCDTAMMNRVAGHRLCTLGGSSTILIEFSSRHPYDVVYERVDTLLDYGYRPLIAHVERYLWAHEDMKRLLELSKLGACIQVNADSVLGRQGWKQKRFCRELMRQDLVDIIASDTHRAEWRVPDLGDCQAYVTRKMGRSYARRIFETYPDKILSE